MIIKVKDTIEREIEIKFPISFKETKDMYIHCYDMVNCIIVYKSHFARYSAVTAMNNYNPSMNCDKSEVDKAFNRVVKSAQMEVLNPITVSMDDNLPTEALEQLIK